MSNSIGRTARWGCEVGSVQFHVEMRIREMLGIFCFVSGLVVSEKRSHRAEVFFRVWKQLGA